MFCLIATRVNAIVTNTTTTNTYATIQAAINDPATLNGHTITFNTAHSEGLINVTKSVTIDGLGNLINSTSVIYGIEVSTINVSLQNLTIQNAATLGIQVDCNSHGLTMTNVTANNNGATGVGINGSDNVVITNLTSTSNDGNGVSITDSDNLSINGITTFGNFFGGGFNAGIGLFTSGAFCPPAGINGFSLTGAVSIAEQTKVYSQKGNAAHVITGLTGPTIEWAVGVGALDRTYWPNKASAYVVVDALFEAPFNYPNTLVYVAEVATEDFYVEDNPAGDPSPPMLIQTAVNFQASGNEILIEPGSYSEQVLVNKSLSFNSATATKPDINYLGTVSGKPTLFDVSADAVSFNNIHFNVDLSKLRSAIIFSGAGIDNVSVTNNLIDAYGAPGGSYGDRNAVSINYAGTTNYRVATGGVNSITFQGNTVNGTMPSSFFRSAVSVDEGGGSFTGNTLQTINHDILVRFGSNGPVTITGNNFNGGGVEVAEQNAAAGTFTISNNIFTGAGAPNTAVLRIKNNQTSIPHMVSLNTFNSHEWGVSMENVNNVTLDGNIFNTASPTAHAVVINTKSISSNSNTIVQTANGATIINNDFNGTGTALTFQNHDSDNDSYGTFVIGSAGNENDFAASLSKFIELDAQSGSSNGSVFPPYPVTGGWPTTMELWSVNLDASNNRYDAGAGLQLPSAMSQTSLFSLEDKVQHAIDVTGLGFVNEKNNNTYVTFNSFLAPLTTIADIQRGVNAAASGYIVNVGPGSFNNDVQVNKSVHVLGTGLNTTTVSGPIGGTGGATFQVQAPNVIIEGMTITRDGNNTTDWNNPGLNSAGIAIQGLTVNAEIRFNKLMGNRTGIDVNNSNGNNIHNNIIDFNRTGLIFRNQTDNTQFLNNFVTNNWTAGILFLDASVGTNSPVQTALNSAFNNNDISGNWYAEIVDRQSGGSLPAPGTTNLKNFTCNWYGGNPPVKTTANSTEPGYAAQIPVAYGGAAVPPGGQPDIAGSASDNFVYAPYLLSGVDVGGNPDDGFQPAPGCIAPCVLILSTTSTDATCPNQNNGTATVNVTAGGTGGPYTYAWANGQTTQTATGLSAGMYNVTVTDVNGCTASTTATVSNSTAGPVHNINSGLNYCSIQSALNDVSTQDGDVITVDAGTYPGNIIVSKEVTILGPNQSVNPCSGMRVSEAIIVPGVSDIGFGEIFHIAASNVTISGFTIDGDNTAIASGFTSTTAADIDAAEGITVYETGINNLSVTNNIIRNLSYFGVTLYDYPSAVPSSGHTISNNKIQDLGTYDPASGIDFWGGGVLLYNNQYAAVTNNCMTNVRIGVQTGNFHLANPGTAAFQEISDNTISARRRGIFHNLFYQSASPYTLDGNNITGISHASETAVWDGILIASMQNTGSTASDNNIDGAGISIPRTGIAVWNDQIAPSISGGIISGVEIGINVNNYESYPSSGSNAGNTQATIDGVTVNGALTAGIKVHDNALNTNGATVFAEISNTTINGSASATGIWISGSDATADIHDNAATITGMLVGVDIDASTSTLFQNRIIANGTGVKVRNGGNLTSATENFIANNTGDGILIEASAGTVGPINNNDLSGNGNFNINHLSSAATNAQCNWYGSADFATAEATINDPSGNLNWVPYLNSGVDQGGNTNDGFQPVPGSCICPSLTFGITATTSNGSSGTANTTGGNATITLEFCLGSHFTFMSYSSQPPANVGFVEQIIGTPPPVVLYNNSLVPVPRTPTDIKPSQVPGFFTGPYGPYSLSAGTSGQLVQTYVPYYDANNNDAYDIGECLDDTLTIVYNVTAPVINNCAVTRNITGCGTGVVTSPVFSSTSAASSYAEFSSAPNNGVATSQCSNWSSVTYQDVFVTNCSTVVTRTWTLEDAGGNEVTCDQTINVDRPNTAPVATPSSGSATVECASAANAPGAPNATDACGASLSAVLTSTVDAPDPVTCEGTRTFTYTYTDCAGLTSNYVFTYTIDRTTAPAEVGGPVSTSGGNVECVASATAPATLPVIQDVCGTTLSPTGPPAIGGTYAGCEGSYTYTYNYTDCSGLTTSWTYTYNIDRTTAPAEAGGPVSASGGNVECVTSATAPATLPVIQDVCGATLSPTGAPAIGGTYAGCEGTYTYTYNYVDCSGLSTSWTYTYTIDRTTAPAETGGPVAIAATVECASAAVAPTLPVIQDVCGATLSPREHLLSQALLPVQLTISLRLSLQDLPRLLAFGIRIVMPPAGFTSPVVFGGDARLKHSIASADGANNRPGAFSSAFYNTQGRKFDLPNGTNYMEIKLYVPSDWATSNRRMAGFWGTAVDASNAISAFPIVEFTSDGNNPRFRAWESGTGVFVDMGLPAGFTYNSWVTLKINLLPNGEFQISAGSTTYTTVTSSLDASVRIDNVILQGHNTTTGVDYDIYWDDFSTQLCEGEITYTYNYQDCSGLSTSWTFTYTIDHTTAPAEVGGPVSTSGGTVECVASATAPTILPVIQDVCGTTLSPSGSPVIGGTYAGCEGTYTYTYHYADCSGLTTSWTYTYTIDRTTAPAEVGGPVSTSGGNVECVASATAPAILPVIQDVCGTTLSPTGPPAIGGTYAGCEGSYTYTYNYTDCSGLTTSWTYTYNIDRTTAPAEVGGPVSTSGGNVECVASATAPATLPVIQDVCGTTLSPTGAPAIGGTYAGCEGSYTYTYNYTDCSGLTTSWTYTYNIDRTTAPAEVGGTVSTSGGNVECVASATAPATLPVIQDVCGATLSPTGAPAIGGTYAGCEGTYTYTYNYVDCSGLSTSWTYTYNIDRTTAPATPPNGSATVECASSATTPSAPAVNDVCGTPLTPTGPVQSGTYTNCEGTIIYTYTYTDCSGLSSAWSYTYTVDRTTAPVVPANGSGTVQNKNQAVPPPTPAVNDVCGNPLNAQLVSVTESPNPLVCEGTRTYNYKYQDCSGLSSAWSFTYTVDNDDNNVCTIDACNSSTGIVTYTQVDRNDNNACTFDGCDPVGGVFHIPYNTSDGNPCTVDACNSTTGAITHTPADVNDGNACTTDACNSSTGGVTHVPVNTNDGNPCTIDACDPSTGNITNTPIDVNDGNGCTVDACNTAPAQSRMSW